MTHFRHVVLTGLCLVAFLYGPAPAVRAAETPPATAESFIQDLGDRAIAVAADKKLPKQERDQRYHALLHDAFDLPVIGRFVLGRYWTTITPEERDEYKRLFEELIVRNYGNKINMYAGEKFEVTGMYDEDHNEKIVNSAIRHKGNAPATDISWRLREKDGAFHIVDVIVEGVSLSITTRQEYAAIIQHNDGKIAPLLDRMREQLQD